MFVLSGVSSTRELERRIVDLAVGMRFRVAEWLALVGELDARGGAAGSRFAGTADWLAFECEITARTARDHVRVARRLTEWRTVAEAFGRGELSYSQVRAITRADVSEDQEALLDVARRSTTAQLERHVRGLRSAPSSDLDAAREAHARRCVEWFHDVDGTLRFWGRLAGEAGVAFVEAVETAAAALHPEPEPVGPDASGGSGGAGGRGGPEASGGPGGPGGAGRCDSSRRRPSRVARRADALAEIALSGSPRTHVVLYVDPQALACRATAGEPRAGHLCALDDGPAVPSELARRLTCDADITVPGPNLGRTQRVVTPALRRALEARDGRCCAMPGCDRRHGLAAHHIVHWAHGGRTDLDNLVQLCPYHHRLHHEEGFTVRRRHDRLLFHDPDGRPLREIPDRAPPHHAAATAA